MCCSAFLGVRAGIPRYKVEHLQSRDVDWEDFP